MSFFLPSHRVSRRPHRGDFRGVRALQNRSAVRRLRVEGLERRELLDGEPLPAAAPGDDLVPDMFAWASQSRSYLHGSYIDSSSQAGRKLLRFATAVANIGQGPMELRGGDILANGNQEVFQRVFKEGGGFTDTLVGEFTYHESHQHIHFDGYAVYHLRQALVDDGVGDIVASGGKVSFCLLDVTRYDSAAPSATYRSCGQTQGIAVGWADIYTATLPDQWIDVTDVSDGEYWLEVVVDPDDRLRETDETNNIARVRVSLGAGGELGDRFETNDAVAQATDLGSIGDRVESDLSIHAPSNDDYFRVEMAAAGTLDVSISFLHSQGDIDVELLDENENVVASADSADDVERITHDVAAGDVYFLRVFGYGGAVNPHYDLAVDGPDSILADRFELNDDGASATDLGELGSRVEQDLSIHAAGNDDYYRFSTAADGTLDVALGFAHALGDVDVQLLDANLDVVAESISTTDDEQLSITVAAGATYYLRVYGPDGATNPSYRLSIDSPVPSGAVAGVVWDDRNGDGVRNALEPGLAGRLIYVDGNGNGRFDSAPPTSEEYVATGLPMPIDDHQTALSTIDVTGVARPIDGVTLQLSLSHPYVGDLHVHLESPSGTRIELFSHVGGSGDDMTATTLSDTAPLSIAQGNAPFSGAYRPLEPLATFVGEDANGVWTLEIDDDEDGDEGSLLAWSLAIVSEGYFEPTAVTDAQGAYVLAELSPGTHTVAQELPPEWAMTFPSPGAAHSVTVNIDETTGDVDFGNIHASPDRARAIDVRLQNSANPASSYSVPVGDGAQLDPIPLVGLDQIVVVFDRVWNVEATSLELVGVNSPTYATVEADFTTAIGVGDTLIATWKLAAPLTADKLLAVVRAPGTGTVTLDGEWTNPIGGQTGSTFPSGDGQSGGDFAFRFNVLAGDANRDGLVDVGDVVHLANNGFVDTSHAGYDRRNDLDANGLVNLIDAVYARDRLNASLPTGEPVLLPPSLQSPSAPSPPAAVIAKNLHRPRLVLAEHRVARADRRDTAVIDAASADLAILSASADDSIGVRAARVRRLSR